MKLIPLVTAEKQLLSNQRHIYSHSIKEIPGLQLEASSSCIQKCVGQTAANACSHCGIDFGCWAQCAGSQGKAQCVSNCF